MSDGICFFRQASAGHGKRRHQRGRFNRFGAFIVAVLFFYCNSGAHAAADNITSPSWAALQRHPSLRSQQAGTGAAQADSEAAQRQFWPTSSMTVESVGASQDDASYRGDASVTYLRLQQPLCTGACLGGNLSRVEVMLVLAQADLQHARQKLALRGIKARGEALVADLNRQACDRRCAIHERLLALVKRRYENGSSARAEVARAVSRLKAQQADLDVANAQRTTALESSCLLTGGVATDDPGRALPLRDEELAHLLNAARNQSPQLQKTHAVKRVAVVEIARAAVSPEAYLRIERRYGNYLQLHQPIYRSAVEQWRLYVAWLGPMTEASSDWYQPRGLAGEVSHA